VLLQVEHAPGRQALFAEHDDAAARRSLAQKSHEVGAVAVWKPEVHDGAVVHQSGAFEPSECTLQALFFVDDEPQHTKRLGKQRAELFIILDEQQTAERT
jgi:hypothetical protein